MIFKNMAIILVKLSTENIQLLYVTLRILCVKCMNCKSTHALLLYFYCSLLSLYAKPSSNISRTAIIVVLFCIQKPPLTTLKL